VESNQTSADNNDVKTEAQIALESEIADAAASEKQSAVAPDLHEATNGASRTDPLAVSEQTTTTASESQPSEPDNRPAVLIIGGLGAYWVKTVLAMGANKNVPQAT
jgi:hypothetical protein